MRVFDLNYAFKTFIGTYTASSNAAGSQYCFDELDYTLWTSSGENSDAVTFYVERDFTGNRTINRVFVKTTNIIDPYVKYWNGSIWVTPTTTRYSATSDTDHILEFPLVTTTKIRVYGKETIIADSEKTIVGIYAFAELGELTIPPSDIKSKRIKEQIRHILDNAKAFMINKGMRWEITLKFKAHIGQTDVTLLESLAERDAIFYIWLNNNKESVMNQKFAPFRFGDVIKVSIYRGDNPSYYKNLYFSGMDDVIRLIEVI